MSPTLRRTISPNTVLLFESGWDILLYESLKWFLHLEFNDLFLFWIKIFIKIWKKCIFVKISISSFFSAPVANFVRIFNLDKVTRRAGCLIPTRRVIRMQGNLHFRSLRHIDEFKWQKWELNNFLYIQIWIWIQKRIEHKMKYILAGRAKESISLI